MNQVIKEKSLLLAALREVRAGVDAGKFPRWGICDGVEKALVQAMKEADGFEGDENEDHTLYLYPAEDIIEQRLQPVFEEWPLFRGSLSYPVPGPGGVGNHSAFSQAVLAEDPKAFWTGEYGSNRRELLDFCIEYLNEELS